MLSGSMEPAKAFVLPLVAFLLALPAQAGPNFIVIFCDDLGYGDLGCYGSTKNRTPHIDSLARNGRKFTDFYSSSLVCTPSRASLLTGCFFLYLPHTFPHLPLFASDTFRGVSANGRYGDTIEEIDWSTGQILACLERLELQNDTLVIFTSDNGSNGRNGESNKPLAGAKGSTMEGGMRVPMIAKWPEKIPPGTTTSAVATTMDLLPTICTLADAPQPKRPIDGHDISALLFSDHPDKSPTEVLYYYRRRQLQAVRWGDWKLHLALDMTHPNWTSPDIEGKPRPAKLVNLKSDLQETTDLSEDHPEVLQKMNQLIAHAISTFGNDAQQGSGQRAAKTLDSSKPLVLQPQPE